MFGDGCSDKQVGRCFEHSWPLGSTQDAEADQEGDPKTRQRQSRTVRKSTRLLKV